MIPEEDFKKIHELMPICGVDLFIVDAGRLLLLKREREPEKGKWWPPGGRLLKGETLLDACRRVARQEAMISVIPTHFIGTLNFQNGKGPFGDRSWTHTLTMMFLCYLPVGLSWTTLPITIDSNHSGATWTRMNSLEVDIPDPVGSVIHHLLRYDPKPLCLEVNP